MRFNIFHLIFILNYVSLCVYFAQYRMCQNFRFRAVPLFVIFHKLFFTVKSIFVAQKPVLGTCYSSNLTSFTYYQACIHLEKKYNSKWRPLK